MHAFGRFTACSVYGRRAARDAAVLELRDHYGWRPAHPFTLPELGGLPQATVSAEETRACLGVRTFFYRALEGGKPVAIVAVFRAGAADPSSALSLVAQRLGLTADVMRVERVWLAVYRRRGDG